jgi:predicted ATP-dependent endonuclease of OLD family
MPLKFASDGQLAAINALLSIPVSAHPTAVVQTANLTVLVGDEVDRHLHPTAADKLFSKIHQLAKESGVTVIAATHSIPLLASHDLTECLRLYAFRDALDRFSITTEPTRDMEVLARELGTDILRARSLVRLHIVVEGEVDEVVIEELLADTSISAGDYAFIRLDGLKNLTRDWRAHLRHLSSPILVVYDKQCADFETAWHKIKSSPQSAIHERSELRRLNNELLERKRKKLFRSGDTELEAVLKLSQELLNSKRIADHPRQIKRTNFFGIPEDDIVDCLPMKYFKQKQLPGMEKMPRAETWAEARKMLTGSSFTLKQVYGINVDAVRTALQKMRTADEVLTHPRLGELRAEVQSFLEAHNDPRAKA